MMTERFDVTFIRGPRDVSPWRKASRELAMYHNSPQNGTDARISRTAYHSQRDGENGDTRFPNAVYQERGRIG